MAIASWQMGPALKAVVGDRGVWSVYTVERGINISPACRFSVDLDDGLSQEAVTDVLGGLEDAVDGSECEVSVVRLPSGSEVSADDWGAVPDLAWPVVAERVLAVSGFRLHISESGLSGVSMYRDEGGFSDTAATLRSALDGGRLEQALGGLAWNFTWRPAAAPPYHALEVEVERTPGPELISVVEGLAAIDPTLIGGDLDADDLAGPGDAVRGVQVEIFTTDGVERARVDLTVDDWNPETVVGQEAALTAESVAAEAATAILQVFADSGWPGEVVVVANDGLSWQSTAVG